MTTIDTHRWDSRLQYQDVQAVLHRPRVRAFLNDVVKPALAAIDADIERWATTQEGGWMFAVADGEALLQATIQAFCLSIQSLWERQLRNWLSACIPPGSENQPKLLTTRKGTLPELSALLHELRGIPLTAFPCYPDLDLLQRVGNACRHGDGRSAVALYRTNPELWPAWSSALFPWLDNHPKVRPPPLPSFEHAVLPRELLERFATAIVGFWEDVEYIRLNSIERKDEQIHAEMERLIQNRKSRV
ncbi:hypothetical protein B0G80_5318 [Paraburkholderia sp. BL6669N2]|uniref:hypothetical protein n=1 Tax=Paraburkholderia sp. BL6669N2 TaxID=1938807 RepID=UPI000E23238C|nr:hypothetical protein [Paraburkholderia sp. BL6669N2]REG48998.1 hypothetical protein B0G80_5318 [Paraburkholderia sp. BL6669N2]